MNACGKGPYESLTKGFSITVDSVAIKALIPFPRSHKPCMSPHNFAVGLSFMFSRSNTLLGKSETTIMTQNVTSGLVAEPR